MNKILLSILCISVAIFATCVSSTAQLKNDCPVNKCSNVSALIDTVSYALGNQYTLASMAGENKLMHEEKDFKDYIRALGDFLPDNTEARDSSYVVSYALGGMQGVFMTDGRQQEELMTELPCVAKGLRKVADGEITLPDDTIKAMDVINRYSPVTANELEGDERCEYLTAIGVMKAYPHGLQEYVDEMSPGRGLIANREAYVAGMADLFELATEHEPKTAYDFGRLIARSMKFDFLRTGNSNTLDKNSFIAGAKAALQMGEQLLPREEAEAIIEKLATERWVDVEDEGNREDKHQQLMEYASKFDNQIELGTRYAVNWHVKAMPVAEYGSTETDTFERFIKENSLDEVAASGTLRAIVPYDAELFSKISSVIERFPLTEGYKWFCAHYTPSVFTVGIMKDDEQFEAIAEEASINFNSHFGEFQLTWKYDKGTAALWEIFTENNIGKEVALLINEQFIMAPKVNTSITSGECAASDVLPKIVNDLFKDAIPIAEELPIEVIDLAE